MKIKQAFNILRDLQKILYSEYASSAYLDEAFNENLYQLFEDSFLLQSVSEKQYYSRILSLISYLNGKDPLFMKPNFLSSEYNNIKNYFKNISEIDIPEFFSIYEEQDEKKLLNTLITLSTSNALTFPLIDILTYSIIPSLFVMFLERDSFNLFCKLIAELKKYDKDGKINKIKTNNKEISLHFYLSRSLFISPFFLKFIHKIFSNFLRPFYHNQQPDKIPKAFIINTQKKLLQSFEKNLSKIPSYLKIFFQKVGNSKSYLIECLFEPMFENPELYLVIDIPATDYKENIDSAKKALKLIFTDELIEKIANLIDNSKNSEESLFEQSDNQQKFYYKIIDSVDLYVLDKINKFIQRNDEKSDIEIDLIGPLKISEYKICKSLFESEIRIKRYKIYNDTEIEYLDYWKHLRKLIKDGPLIPENLSFSEDEEKVTPENFLQMVKSLFVDSYEPFKQNEAQIVYNVFSSQFKEADDRDIIFSTENFQSKIENFIIVHQEYNENVEKMNQLCFDFDQLSIGKIFIIELNLELYKTVITNIIQKNNGLKSPSLCTDFIQDPVNYRHLFIDYLNEQNKKSKFLGFKECQKIWFHRFHHNLDFFNYCACRSDLLKYDQMAHFLFKRFISNSNLFLEKKVRNSIQYFTQNTDDFLEVKEAFESNGDPLEKFEKIYNTVNNLANKLSAKFHVIGEDYLIEFRGCIFSYVDPPRFITNFTFILEFLFNCKNPIINYLTFNSLYTSFIAIIIELKDTFFFNNPLLYLSRCHHINLDIFITGINPDSIVKLLKYFFLSIKGRKPDENKLDKYVALMNSNPKKKFSLSTNFFEMDNNSFQLCFVTTIYFGQEIQLKSDSSETKNKIGLYAYKYDVKYRKKLINNVNEFAASKLIEDRNKLVVLENHEDVEFLQLPKNIANGSYENVKNVKNVKSLMMNIFKNFGFPC